MEAHLTGREIPEIPQTDSPDDLLDREEARLQLRNVSEERPPGSSYSTAHDGARALYDWMGALGLSTSRLQRPSFGSAGPPSYWSARPGLKSNASCRIVSVLLRAKHPEAN